MGRRRGHKACGLLVFNLAQARRERVCQPKYAGYLNLIAPWWEPLRSLALAGRFFETWEHVEDAIGKARDYWNAHRRPYVWGKRKRHRAGRRAGLAAMPRVASQPG